MAIRAQQQGLRGEIPEPDAEQEGTIAGLGFQKPGTIYEREDDYRRRRLDRIISPARNDAFAMGDKTPDNRVRTYADIMREQQLQREMDNTMRNIADKKRKEAEAAAALAGATQQAAATTAAAPTAAATAGAPPEKRRRRWDSDAPAQ